MPTYEYYCENCTSHFEVVKSIHDYSNDPSAFCDCGFVGIRQISQPPGINDSVCSFEAHFNYGLGKEVHSNRQLKNEVKRLRGETGMDIQPVGTDTLGSIKKKRKSYDSD